MENKNYTRIRITDCSETNPDFQKLYSIFAPTLKPDMEFREFRAYYYSHKLEYIDATLVEINGALAGFCAAAFYKTEINGKPYTIGRAATGILPQYRGNTLPKWKLYFKYIRYKFFKPFSNVVLSAYVANPIIYAMICKYTGLAYPRQKQNIPESIVQIKDELLRSQRLQKKEGPQFVVQIHFCVAMGEDVIARIFTSKDRNVKHFLSINPRFREQYGVVVIIPVTVWNCVLSSCRFVYFFVCKILEQMYFSCKKGKNIIANNGVSSIIKLLIFFHHKAEQLKKISTLTASKLKRIAKNYGERLQLLFSKRYRNKNFERRG